jgi:hypothetical protein
MRGFGVVGLVLAAWAIPAEGQAPDPRLQRSWQLSFQSDARRAAGDLIAAERLAREAETICPQLGDLAPFCLVPARHRLGAVALARGELDTAERLYRDTLAMAEAAYPPPSPWHVMLRQQLAHIIVRQGRPGDADAILRPALPAARALAQQQPEMLPAVLNAMAFALLTQRRWLDAEDAAREAVRVLEAANRQSDPTYDAATVNLSEVLMQQDRPAEAVALIATLLSDKEARLGRDHHDLALPLLRLASLKRAQGQSAEAALLAGRAVALLRRAPAMPLQIAEALNTLGVNLDEAGQWTDAARAFEEAIAQRDIAGDRSSPALAFTLTNFANLRIRQGQMMVADPLLRRALAIHEAQSPRDEDAVAGALVTLLDVLLSRSALDEAAAIPPRFDRILVALSTGDLLSLRAARLRGELARRQGRPVEAVALLARVRDDMAALGRAAEPHLPATLTSLGLAQMEAGDHAAAAATFAAVAQPSPAHLLGHAQALSLLGRAPEAVMLLRSAAAGANGLLAVQIQINLAIAADRTGDRTEADARLVEASGLIDQPAARRDPRQAVAVLSEFANYASRSGRPALALAMAGRAVTAANRAAPDRLLLDALRAEGQARVAANDREGARRAFDRQLVVAQALYPADHPRVGGVYFDLAALARLDARYEEAERFAAEAAARFGGGRYPNDLAQARNQGAMAALALGRLADAEAGFGAALKAAGHASLGPTTARQNILTNLSTTLRRAGRTSEAISAGREALAMAEVLDGGDNPAIAPVLNVLALALLAVGQPNDAILLFSRSLELRERGFAPNDPERARGYSNLGSAFLGEGRVTEAAPLIERGVALAEAALGPVHPDLTDALAPLASLRAMLGQDAEAEALRRRILAILEGAFGPRHSAVGAALSALSGRALEAGRTEEALALSRRAIEILTSVHSEAHPQVIASRIGFGQALLAAGRTGEAENEFGLALHAAEARGTDGRFDVVSPLLGLARTQDASLQRTESLAQAQRALTVVEAGFGQAHPWAGEIRLVMAGILQNMGRTAEVERIYRNELTAGQARLPAGTPTMEFLKLALAELLSGQGRGAEAQAIASGAMASMERSLQPRDPRRVALLSAAANVAAGRGDVVEAERLAVAAVAAHEAAGLPPDIARVALLLRSAMAKLANDKPAEALVALGAARAFPSVERSGQMAADDARIGALIAAWAGQLSEAEGDLARYRALLATANPPDRAGLATASAITGRIRLMQHRIPAAVEAFEAALAEATATDPRLDRPAVAGVLLGLADAYEGAGRAREAEQVRVRALSILERIGWTGRPPDRWL